MELIYLTAKSTILTPNLSDKNSFTFLNSSESTEISEWQLLVLIKFVTFFIKYSISSKSTTDSSIISLLLLIFFSKSIEFLILFSISPYLFNNFKYSLTKSSFIPNILIISEYEYNSSNIPYPQSWILIIKGIVGL